MKPFPPKYRKEFKPKGFVTPEMAKNHAQMLSNRVRNRFRHLSKRFRRENIDCFRLYDWDIPEVRAVVDWYAGHLVVAEYERLQTGPEWLPQMAQAVAAALDVPPSRLHIKRRHTNTKEGPRYKRMGSHGERFEARERDLKFWINLDDFLDTGLYSDHRNTRVIIREMAKGQDFLNLFAYTGAFTVAAAAGGAKSTVTVDRNATYIKWTKENLELNKLFGAQHKLVQSDVDKYLAKTAEGKERFTLALVDPPSFFKDEVAGVAFDVNKDHHELLKNVLKVMRTGGVIFFSSNHQRFAPKLDGLRVKDLQELTPQTIPEDYRNRKVHRCWRMVAI